MREWTWNLNIFIPTKDSFLKNPSIFRFQPLIFWRGCRLIFIAHTLIQQHFDGSLLLAFLAVFWEGAKIPTGSNRVNFDGRILPNLFLEWKRSTQPPFATGWPRADRYKSGAITNPYNWPKINGFDFGWKTPYSTRFFITPTWKSWFLGPPCINFFVCFSLGSFFYPRKFISWIHTEKQKTPTPVEVPTQLSTPHQFTAGIFCC